jgi:outer membrane PBP1 activator LpoA protein
MIGPRRLKGREIVSVFLLAMALAGCNAHNPVKFNDTIVNAQKKLDDSSANLYEASSSALDGKDEEVAKMKAAHDACVRDLREAQSTIGQMKVPDESEAKAFHAAAQKYLSAKEQMIVKDMGEVVKILEDKSMDSSERVAKVLPIIERVADAEKKELDTLQSAQQAYASKHNMKIR